MKKEQLETAGKCSIDLLRWIKYFLQDKVAHQKVQEDYSDNEKEAKKYNLKYFDRKLWQLRIEEADTSKELKEVTKSIACNGIRSHNSFSTPLLNFYEHIITVERLKSIKDIDTNLINIFIELKLSDKKEWTQRNYYVQIKSLFRFINKYSISNDYFIFDIGIVLTGKRVKTPIKNTPSKSIKYLEPNEFESFINSINSYSTAHPNTAQPKLLMKVISFTGLRAAEVRSIKLKDVSTKIINGKKYLQIYIQRKNNEDYCAFIYYENIQKEYEQELAFKKEHKIKTEYLFYTRSYAQYAEKSLYDLIKRHLKHAGITKPMDSHGLRRSYAAYLLSKGVSREKINNLLRLTTKEIIDFCVFPSERK